MTYRFTVYTIPRNSRGSRIIELEAGAEIPDGVRASNACISTPKKLLISKTIRKIDCPIMTICVNGRPLWSTECVELTMINFIRESTIANKT